MSSSSALPKIPNTNPDLCVFDLFRTAIAKRVAEALPPLTVEQVYTGVDYGKKGADFTIALPRFRLPGKVDELARKVIAQFQPDEYVSSITADKSFLHFQLNTSTLIQKVLTQVYNLNHNSSSGEPEYGANPVGNGKKVIIEYSSPNIAKSFHVGHLRSTIIGAFLANLYKLCGWEVWSLNYLGDWGTQFGMIAHGFEKYGSDESLKKDAIKHLLEVYVKASKDAENDPTVKPSAAAFFKRMEDGDEAVLANWRTWRELSVKKYEEEYDRLNIHFDEYVGESLVSKEWIDKASARLEEMGLVTETEDGAKIINLEKWKLGSAVLKKKDGTSIYLTRDIGGAIQRYDKYKFDKMIYVVSSQQDLHVAQFFKILELLQYPWAASTSLPTQQHQSQPSSPQPASIANASLVHINYGMVLGMSTRKGTVVFLDDIIKEAGRVMHEQMLKNEEKYKNIEDPEETSREIGISAVKVQDMAAKRINNYTFNWERMTSFEGDTGPYLQYAHVRLCSIARKNPELLPLPLPVTSPSNPLTTSEPFVQSVSATFTSNETAKNHAREIVFLLGSYPDVVRTALATHEPSGVLTFAFRLSHAISSAWEVEVVKGEADLEKARARLWLFECAKEVLGSAMRLVGLRPLERM